VCLIGGIKKGDRAVGNKTAKKLKNTGGEAGRSWSTIGKRLRGRIRRGGTAWRARSIQKVNGRAGCVEVGDSGARTGRVAGGNVNDIQKRKEVKKRGGYLH